MLTRRTFLRTGGGAGSTRPGAVLSLALAALVVGSGAAHGQARTEPGGKRTMRAVSIDTMLTIDGRLDEPEWQRAPSAGDFVQKEPRDDRAPSEKTDVRILYNNTFLYIGAICYDSDPEGILVSDLVEDHLNSQEDSFGVVIDTFNDEQNAVQFETNPAGSRTDYQHTGNGSVNNRDWDAVWYVKTSRRSDGWAVEIAIPFRSLRFSAAPEQIWGLNFRRRIRRKNEEDVWNPVPRSQNFWVPSLAGRLEGLKDIRPGRNLFFKPFVLGGVDDRRDTAPSGTRDAGLDVKYGITSGLTLDATYRTDFAQAEVDQQQVNLTRFSLFFPEKREFFLENAGVFSFAGQGSTSGGGGGGFGSGSSSVSRPAPFGSNDFILLFSRRIGLSAAGAPVPIEGGVRLTGKLPYRTELGLFNITSGDAAGVPAANYSVAKIRKNLLRSSDVGVMLVDRESKGRNFTRVVGVEQNLRFFANTLNANAFWARAFTPGVTSDNQAWGLSTSWRDRKRSAGISYREIQANFNNDIGFVRRKDIRQTRPYVGLFLRPGPTEGFLRHVREVSPQVSLDYVLNSTNRLVTRTLSLSTDVFLQSGTKFTWARSETFDRIERAFVLGPGAPVPAGDYRVTENEVEYSGDESEKVAGHLRLTTGEFYGGTRNGIGMGLLVRPSYHFWIRVEHTRNNVELPSRHFVTNLEAVTTTLSLTPPLTFSTIVQYNSDVRQILANVRFRYNYRPWNDFFIVYNETRDVFGRQEKDRALVLKLTYALGL